MNKTFHKEINTFGDRECDGCGRSIPVGETHLTNTTSCCIQDICRQCVERAAELMKDEWNRETTMMSEAHVDGNVV